MEEKNMISNWLDKLQRESWNLELLISGFSIFLLFQTGDILEDGITTIRENYTENVLSIAIILLMGTTYIASKILTVNLIVHVILRGVWIGTIGLRSVQEKTDFDQLNYTPYFTEKLKEKVSNLDNLLIRLDTVCSVIFAFTFLIVFMFFSLFMFFAFLVFISFLISQLTAIPNGALGEIPEYLELITLMILMISGLVYMIDTLTLGLFKKIKWLQKIYYPIYVFYGYITLAGIYRSIYYALITRFSRKLVLSIMLPYIFICMLTPFHKFDQYQFYPDHSSPVELSTNCYDDQRGEEEYIRSASIPSMFVSQSFLPLFIRYDVQDNATILHLCDDYEPSKSSGFISGIHIGKGGFRFNNPQIKEADPQKLLNCLSQLFTIYVNDSLYTSTEFYYFTKVKNKEMGIQTIIPTATLPKGKNVIRIKRFKIDEAAEEPVQKEEKEYALIPFWLE